MIRQYIVCDWPQAWQKVTAAYCQSMAWFTSRHLRADCLYIHRDQLRAQRSVTSMGKLYLLTTHCAEPIIIQLFWLWFGGANQFEWIFTSLPHALPLLRVALNSPWPIKWVNECALVILGRRRTSGFINVWRTKSQNVEDFTVLKRKCADTIGTVPVPRAG